MDSTSAGNSFNALAILTSFPCTLLTVMPPTFGSSSIRKEFSSLLFLNGASSGLTKPMLNKSIKFSPSSAPNSGKPSEITSTTLPNSIEPSKLPAIPTFITKSYFSADSLRVS
ncbi:hypothetical protein D3C78_1535750 [compost metagenome]